MFLLPRAIQNLIEAFERLPGIGPKTAARLSFYLLHCPQEECEKLSGAISELKSRTVLCSLCHNVAETDPCPVCGDPSRDRSIICVVENSLDVFSLEKTGHYKGLYHVLHGVISPLENIGPDELYLNDLPKKLEDNEVKELILALNPTMEGEATSMYIKDQLKTTTAFGGVPPEGGKNEKLKISRIGQGLPIGADIEYADEITLLRAMEGRREY